MANPVTVSCPANQWTKIATDVVSGTIRILLTTPHLYLETYRMTGDAAPINRSDGDSLSDGDPISAIAGIDVYVWADVNDGAVRVYLP